MSPGDIVLIAYRDSNTNKSNGNVDIVHLYKQNEVNKNVKRILEQILDDTKKMVKISPSFQVKPVEIREGSFRDWIKKYTRKVVRKIFPYMKVIVKANNDLRKMI